MAMILKYACTYVHTHLDEGIFSYAHLAVMCNSLLCARFLLVDRNIMSKTYCMGGLKCRALPLYTIKLTKGRIIFVLPRMWLGPFKYCPGTLVP